MSEWKSDYFPQIMFEILSNYLEESTVFEEMFRYVSEEEMANETNERQIDFLYQCQENTSHLISLCKLYNWWHDHFLPWRDNRRQYYLSQSCKLESWQHHTSETIEIDNTMRRALLANMKKLVDLHENLWM